MTLKSDMRLARTYGPLVARTLTANIAEVAHFRWHAGQFRGAWS